MIKSVLFKVADKRESILARRYVSKKFCEAGFLPKEEYGKPFSDKYISNSTYIIASEKDSICGVIRLVEKSKIGLPVINNFKIDDNFKIKINKTSNDKIVEVGNLAAESKKGIALGLYKKALKFSFKSGHRYWLAGIDANFLNGLTRKYKITKLVFREIGAPRHYIGSKTIPIMIPIWPLVIYSFFLRFDVKKDIFGKNQK
jgi:hypothetical protein